MSGHVPISINRVIAIGSHGRGRIASPAFMIRIMTGCVKALEELGKLGTHVVAMKVEPRCGHAPGSEESASFDIRIVLLEPTTGFEPKSHELEMRFTVYRTRHGRASIQRTILEGICKEVRHKIAVQAAQLKHRSARLSELVAEI